MRQKVVWFILGVLVGSLMLVYAAAPTIHPGGKCARTGLAILSAGSHSNYTIQGPFNWTPRPVSKKLPVEIFKLVTSRHPALRDSNHLVTLIHKRVNYSIFEVGSGNLMYVEWSHGKIMNIGEIHFEPIESSTKTSSKTMGSILGHRFKVVAILCVTKWRAVTPKTLNSLYMVTASETYTWYTVSPITGKEFKWSETTAKGKFYVDYGNAVVGISDMSSEWHDKGVTACSFSHGKDGANTVSGEVYADAKYLVPTPLGIHFDAHARVYVDAWTNVDTDSWGNKGVGRPWCS